jgi:quinoprotein glucose dehydrogenase
MKRGLALLAAYSPALLLCADWPNYGNDPGGMRYATSDQINRANVDRLAVAWTYRTKALEPATELNRKAAFEATPILVNGTLYLSTPFNKVIALDPATGAERWSYDPRVDRSKSYSEVTSRGVSHSNGRIYFGTIDARLIALDARSGRPAQEFGDNGQIDLSQGVGLKDRGDYQVTSPPALIGDVVVVGSSIGDNRRYDLESGVVRAYDARTGKLRWSWDPLPNSGGTGGANAWAVISADPERDMVFVPTSSPGPDFFGGRRAGSNLYANSVVALKASTGKLLWHFQVVHHDLWDYDVASQPVLVTIGGKPAVAVTTKIGHLFVLDRETGKPLLPVDEKPVPKSDVPGEDSSPTQPFPRNASLAPSTLRPADAWGVTLQERAACRQRIAGLRSDGIFTPPSLRGSILFPGNVGGVNWGGAAHDPKRGVLVAPTNRLATVVTLIPREQYSRRVTEGKNDRLTGEFSRQEGTPFGMYRELLRSPRGFFCNMPPWGALTAVDLATGAKRWEVPLGVTKIDGIEIAGVPNLGGPLITAGGLVFISATLYDDRLRAFDIDTGKVLWEAPLPAGGQATPMSYEIGGRQYVVIAAGGHGKAQTTMGDHVVAFALP